MGIERVRGHCVLLAALTREFETTRPFAGLPIGTGIHPEPRTASPILALKAVVQG